MAASVKLRGPTREEKDKIYNAAYDGDIHTIQELASSGVDVTGIVDGHNKTALHMAVRNGHNNIVTFLLSHGARVNDVDSLQRTALHWAALHGHTDTVDVLVKSGADVNMKDKHNSTALHRAGANGHNNIVTFLLSHGARVNDVDSRQMTALHWAASSGHTNTVDVLVKSGADVNMKDNKNRTPLECAVEEGRSEVIEYFIKNLKIDTTKFNEDTQQRIRELLKETEKEQNNSNDHPGSHDLQQDDYKEQIQQALSQALRDGVANPSSVTIYVLGQECSGKSCLVASLLGDKFEERIATQGADIDICKIFASQKWSRIERSKVPKKLQNLYYGQLHVTAKIQISAEQQGSVSQAKNRQQLLESLPELPEAVKADLEQAKTAVLVDEDGINAIIWDFAGQSVYYGLHSMFLKEDNVAMIVFDASQPLQDRVKGRDRHKDPYTQKSISPTTTGCESVCYWLQSIHSIRKDGAPLGATSIFVPTVFLVATHIDLIGDSEAVKVREKEIIDQLVLLLQDKPFAKHIAGVENGLREALEKNCFFISNKVRNEVELDRLRSMLVEALLYIKNREHPVVFLNIEKTLLSLDKVTISTTEFHAIAHESGFFAEPESTQLKGALAHFHSKGTILHFPQVESLKDLVVLSPDWLTKLFSYIIVAHPYVLEIDHRLQFKRLKDHGILQEDFITFMVNKFNEEQEKFGLPISTKQAIEFAQLFGFVAEVHSNTYFLEEEHQPPVSVKRVFIVPPMLPLKLPDNVQLPDDKDPQARIVYFKFSEGFIPPMVYYQMLSACIDRNIRRQENLYWIRRHMIKMVLGYDQLYYVSLCEDHHSIRLAITPDDDGVVTQQGLQEGWKFIEEFNAKLMKTVKAFMPASDLPQRYIPCGLCPNLHLKLDDIRADDKPLYCKNGKLPKDYYSDLRQYQVVHETKGAKVTGDFTMISQKVPTMKKLVPYLDKVPDWERFGYQLLPEEKEHLIQKIHMTNHTEAILLHSIHVDGPYQINCDGQSGGFFAWSDCGLELTFPPKCAQQNIQVTMSAFLPVNQELHPGVYIVSAVYKFDCNIKHFDIPFILCLQHCVKLQSPEDCRKMRFFSQRGDNVDIKYGNFEIGKCYGTLNLNRFCVKCITYSTQEKNYLEAPIDEDVLPNQNDHNSETSSANSQPNVTPEINSDISHESPSGQHNSSSTSYASADVSFPKLGKTQEQIESLPWGYEWMLALPKDHLKLPAWNGIYSVYINLRAWRKISVESIQADKITVPFCYAAKELTFDADGIATINCITSDSETTTWYIDCWPKEIKKKDVNIGFLDYDKKKDPNYKENKLLTMILKSYITITKDVSDTSEENCQLVIKGIAPPLQVDLCSDCYDSLTILGTIESHSTNVKAGPVKVADPTYTGQSLHHTSTYLHHTSSILQQEPEMADLNNIVIPRIKAEWEDVAYALRYKIVTVNAIKEKHNENPKKCCRELFIDWLSTSHGVGPKTWSTLLDKLKEVEDLSVATQEIIKELEKFV